MLKKPNILVVGSFMMDLIASTHRAPQSGETVIGLKFQTAPGGKGANQAVQCARLGAHVTMVGQVGGDAFGKIMLDTAAKAGVDVSHVTVDENESSGVGHIVLEVTEHGAQNRITVCPGANFTLTVDDVAWLKDEIRNYDLVMMQFELPMEVVEAVAQWAHDAGVTVMINPAPAAPISDKLLACTTYLSPNEHEAAASLVLESQKNGGRIHVTGIGKCSHVATYAASLLSSTGNPAYYLHGTEAVHGSCGQLASGDVVIAISNSGETNELKATVLAVKNNGCKVIGVSGNPESWLAKESDAFLVAGVHAEGGPLNRAPRNSVLAEELTLQALSVALQVEKDWDPVKYVRCHPGGKLGALRENEK